MKKGFTLVELLAVIAILSILAIIAVPTYNVVSNRIKQSTYETKVQNIISRAEEYAENSNRYVFDVGTLIEQGLLESDNEASQYLDPRTGRDMRCDIINVVFENNQYVASITESETCYTDEELENLFGMFEIKIYRPDGTEVEPIEGTDWIREQDVILKYEIKDTYQDYMDDITQIIWSGEAEKVCEQNDLSACDEYEIHTDVIKNVTVNLQINLNINGSTIISRTNKKVLVDLKNPSIDNIVTGTDLNEQEKNKTEFDLSDGNGSGVKYYAILSGESSCSGEAYESARKTINSNHIVEYLDSGEYTICVEDNVGNKGEGSVSLREINFDANGGTVDIDKKVIGTNTSYGVMPTPTRDYHHFLGWYTSPSGGTEVTTDTILTENTTVYAHWQIYTYTISYNANGGTGAPASQTKTHGVNLTLSTTKPTRTGYTFLGWSTSSTATSATYTAGGTFTQNANTTLYAVWKINTYTITYNANGGSVSPTTQTKNHGSTYGSMPTPTRANHKFLGWFTAINGGTQITSSSTVTGNITLYAHWQINAYTVTYNYSYNGGTSASATSASVAIGSAVNLNVTANKSGYNFLGWNTNANATSGLSSLTMGNSNITLYAIFRKTITVTMVDYNGTSKRTKTATGYAYNRNTSTSITLNTIGKWKHPYCGNDQLDIVGWTTSTSATAGANYASGATATFSNNTTLYARYNQFQKIYIYKDTLTYPDPSGTRYVNSYNIETNVYVTSSNCTYSGGLYGYWTFTFPQNCTGRKNGFPFKGYANTSVNYGSADSGWYKAPFTVNFYCSENWDCQWGR